MNLHIYISTFCGYCGEGSGGNLYESQSTEVLNRSSLPAITLVQQLRHGSLVVKAPIRDRHVNRLFSVPINYSLPVDLAFK